MSYQIEKGVPLPETRGKKSRFPLDVLEVGDSFVIESYEVNAARKAKSVYGLKSGKVFAVRMSGDDYRVWRTA